MRRSREAGMQAEVHQELLRLLRRLMQDVDAKRFFNEAVDPDALGIPEYREIIKEPMDLGSVFWKLKDHTYKEISSFFSDLHLVWRNCQMFNQAGSPVYIASEKLSSMFETWWNRARRQLKMEDVRFAFGYQKPTRALDEAKGSSEGEGTRSRRLIVKKTFDDAASSQLLTSATTQQKPAAASKLKIKLGKGTKRDHSSRSRSASLFGKGKERTLDAEAMRQLDSCIAVLDKLNQNSHAVILQQASLQPTFVPSLTEISFSLIEARSRSWTQSPYSCSRDVLQEAGLYLRSQAVKNEHRRKIVNACQGLLKSLERIWVEAGFEQDVESLKGLTDERMHESGCLPESNLRVTKARMEKLKRQEMEKEVREAENAISHLEKAKSNVEQCKAKLDKTKDALKEATRNWGVTYKSKLTHLMDLGKAKEQAQRQKDKALAAIKASQVAVERMREKESALNTLKEEETRLLTALEDEQSKLEVRPRDAVLVDQRHYSKKQKTKADTSDEHLLELGTYWLGMSH